jgi:hypothetical protein
MIYCDCGKIELKGLNDSKIVEDIDHKSYECHYMWKFDLPKYQKLFPQLPYHHRSQIRGDPEEYAYPV